MRVCSTIIHNYFLSLKSLDIDPKLVNGMAGSVSSEETHICLPNRLVISDIIHHKRWLFC